MNQRRILTWGWGTLTRPRFCDKLIADARLYPLAASTKCGLMAHGCGRAMPIGRFGFTFAKGKPFATAGIGVPMILPKGVGFCSVPWKFCAKSSPAAAPLKDGYVVAAFAIEPPNFEIVAAARTLFVSAFFAVCDWFDEFEDPDVRKK